MQVNDTTNMKNKESAFNTLKPLNWLLKIFSLNSNANHSTAVILKSVLNAAIFGSITLYSGYYNFANAYNNVNLSVKLTDLIQMIYNVCQYNVDLIFVFKYGRHISVEYFKQYDRIDRILGVTNYLPIKKKLRKLIIFFVTIWLISSSCDFGAWVLESGWYISILCILDYIYLGIKILTTLDLTCNVLNTEMRLKIIGDYLQNYYSKTEGDSEIVGDSFICNKNSSYSISHSNTTNKTRNNSIQLVLFNTPHEIKWLTKCYLMLTEQVEYVNGMYGFRVLLNSLSLLIDMIRFTNLGFRIIIGSQSFPNHSGLYPALSGFLRLLTIVAVLTSLVHHCEQAYSQRVRIIRLTDHLLIYKKPDEILQSSTKELQELVQNRPISFNMANFFTLRYSLLTSIASVVVTYTIIILQNV